MMNICYYITGYLLIEVQGKTLEKFINIAIEQQIYFWGVRKDGNKIYLKTHIKNFFVLRSLAKKTHCHIHIVEKYGLPFLFLRLKKRKMLMAGGIVSLVLLYIFSYHIWFIQIDGLKNVQPETILKIAQSQGLEPGALKLKLNNERIQKEILKQIDEISWVGINLSGCKAHIRVVEKIIIKKDMPCNLIAKKAGVIEKFIVLDGQPVVEQGETVKKGQILVKGIRAHAIKDQDNPDNNDGDGEEERDTYIEPTHARAIIEARVKYSTVVTVPLRKVSEKLTGNFIREIGIALPGKEIMFNSLKEKPYSSYQKELKRKKLFAWRNIQIPVEGIIITYKEIERHEENYTKAQAKEKAVETAWQKMVSMIPSDARIVKRDIQVMPQKDEQKIKVKIITETIEDIAQLQNIKGGTISFE